MRKSFKFYRNKINIFKSEKKKNMSWLPQCSDLVHCLNKIPKRVTKRFPNGFVACGFGAGVSDTFTGSSYVVSNFNAQVIRNLKPATVGFTQIGNVVTLSCRVDYENIGDGTSTTANFDIPAPAGITVPGTVAGLVVHNDFTRKNPNIVFTVIGNGDRVVIQLDNPNEFTTEDQMNVPFVDTLGSLYINVSFVI